MSPIRVLDRSVAERIAAGEVIERPASVVKELLENSLDAAASNITVEVEGGGLRLIRVIDDGTGIAADEVPLAFERFATSKIERVEDLDAARSYGFRGEALPSIAAVSRVTITTRTPEAETATRARLVGAALQQISPYGAPPGTMVEVTTLFYNTPARLKFLKSPAREQAFIAEAVQRAAMAHSDVAFILKLDGRQAGRWPRAARGLRVADLLGAGAVGDLIFAEGSLPTGTLHGWFGRPERSRPTRAGQYVFVNRRPVQNALLRRAVEQAYAQLLPVGRFPVFALFVEIDPAAVDVNIHPRKLEVRFREEDRLFGAIVRSTRQALLASPLVRQVAIAGMQASRWSAAPAASGSPSTATADLSTGIPLVLEAREGGGAYDAHAGHPLHPLRPLGQLLDTYVLAEGAGVLYLIDQHAAHERVLYERLLAARRKGGVVSQGLTVPMTIDVTPAQMALMMGYLDHLAELGYGVEPFGAHTVMVRAVPALGSERGADVLFRRAVGALAGEGGDDTLERLAIATACHTAIRAGDPLRPEAIATLLADLAATEDPYTCFHGRPTIIAISRDQLERWFLRG